MSTLGEMVDRAYRDFLQAPDDQPLTTVLTQPLTAESTTVYFDSGILPGDELDAVGIGALLEVDHEQMRVTDFSGSTLTVRRGANATEATEHLTGAEVVISPSFTRRAVREAVADNVVGLYPRLWRTRTVPVTTGAVFAELPADAIDVEWFRPTAGGRIFHGRVLDNFSPSSTGQAAVFEGAPAGLAGFVSYRSAFPRPDHLDTDLHADCGVKPGWERIVLFGAVGQILLGTPEINSVTQSFITEQLQSEAFPPTTATRIARALLSERDRMLDEASRGLVVQQNGFVRHEPVNRTALR